MKPLQIFCLTVVLITSPMSVAHEISADFVKKELDLAFEQYLHGPSESGFYALEALARLLESDNSAALQSELGANNLSFTYLRTGLLHEKAGNTAEATTYFDKALVHYQGNEADLSKLKAVVLQLDNQQRTRFEFPLSQ